MSSVTIWMLLGLSTWVIATGGSHLSQSFWEHENLSGLRVIQLIQSCFHWFIWKSYVGKKSGLTRNPA